MKSRKNCSDQLVCTRAQNTITRPPNRDSKICEEVMSSTLCDEEYFESNFQELPFTFVSSDLGPVGSSESLLDQDFSGYQGRNREEISLQSPSGTVPGFVYK